MHERKGKFSIYITTAHTPTHTRKMYIENYFWGKSPQKFNEPLFSVGHLFFGDGCVYHASSTQTHTYTLIYIGRYRYTSIRIIYMKWSLWTQYPRPSYRILWSNPSTTQPTQIWFVDVTTQILVFWEFCWNLCLSVYYDINVYNKNINDANYY